MTYTYQKTKRYFAQVANDIKDLAEAELRTLGGTDVAGAYRGIYFNAEPQVLYRVNYQSRLISRVLAPLRSFHCPSDQVLYQQASKIHYFCWMK